MNVYYFSSSLFFFLNQSYNWEGQVTPILYIIELLLIPWTRRVDAIHFLGAINQ